jgi:hypothetical protein
MSAESGKLRNQPLGNGSAWVETGVRVRRQTAVVYLSIIYRDATQIRSVTPRLGAPPHLLNGLLRRDRRFKVVVASSILRATFKNGEEGG